jgi:hypothetical protein
MLSSVNYRLSPSIILTADQVMQKKGVTGFLRAKVSRNLENGTIYEFFTVQNIITRQIRFGYIYENRYR